jgi:hypothetical protein
VEEVQLDANAEDLEIQEGAMETSFQEKIDSELKSQDSPEGEVITAHEEDNEENLSVEKESQIQKEMILPPEPTQQMKITAQPEESQNQQWVYLTLLQQQIDILRTQMMHLLNKEHNLNRVSVSTNTPSVSIQESGTNTSFKVDAPEMVNYLFFLNY